MDTILFFLVKQNTFVALIIVDYTYALEVGKIVLPGTGEALLRGKGVKKLILENDTMTEKKIH